ncbi:unnamed protein product, partial [Amoebophrya sp. A120]
HALALHRPKCFLATAKENKKLLPDVELLYLSPKRILSSYVQALMDMISTRNHSNIHNYPIPS